MLKKNLPIDEDGLYINVFLTDTCLTAQDQYRALLDYFKIAHK